MKRFLVAISLLLGLAYVPAAAQSKTTCLDFGWKFIEQNVSEGHLTALDDSKWQSVNLPHDWDIFHKPSADAPTGNGGGYFPGGTGWYRKQIKDTELKVNDGEGLWLHFEGVYHDGNLVPDAAIPVSLKVAGKANISVSSSAIDGIGSMTLRVE